MLIRRILLTLLAFALAAASVWFYETSRPEELRLVDPVRVIPDSIATLYVVNDPVSLVGKLNNQPVFTEMIPGLEWLQRLNSPAPEVRGGWYLNEVVCLFEHQEQDWLVFGLPAGSKQQEIEHWFVEHLKAQPVKSGRLSLPEEQLYVQIGKGVVAFTDDPDATLPLVELDDEETRRYDLALTRSGECDITQIEDRAAMPLPMLQSKNSGMVVRDLYLSNQRLVAEEIIESARVPLSMSPLPASWSSYLPVDLTDLSAIGAASGYDLIERRLEALDSEHSLAQWNGKLAELENAAGVSAGLLLEDWWSDGMARFTSANKDLLLLGCGESSLAQKALSSLPGSEISPLAGGQLITWESAPLLDHLLYPYLRENITAAWVNSELVVFSASPESLVTLASKIKTGQTIDNDHLVAKALSRSERFIHYAQLESKALHLLSHLALPIFPSEKKEPTHFIYSGKPSFDDRMVTRTELSAAARPVADITLEWEAIVAGIKPLTIHSVKNHQNGEYYMVVQDNRNTVHAIDARGQKMWSYECDGELIGEFQAIDLYRNGKYQIAFTTSKALHCLDLRGRSVKGFPVRPDRGASITSPLYVADYDNNRNYRFLVGVSDGRLLNFKDEGQKTNGWKHSAGKASVTACRHIKAANRDYIFVSYANGQVDLLKRDGGIRYDTKLELPPFEGSVNFRMTDDIAQSTVIVRDTAGFIIEAGFGNKGGTEQSALGKADALLMADIDGDRLSDMIIADGTSLKAFNSSYKLIYERSFTSDILAELREYSFSSGVKVGVVLPTIGQIHLLENDGSTADGFPLFGAGPFVIRDLDNDGRLELISTDGEGLLVCYQL